MGLELSTPACCSADGAVQLPCSGDGVLSRATRPAGAAGEALPTAQRPPRHAGPSSGRPNAAVGERQQLAAHPLSAPQGSSVSSVSALSETSVTTERLTPEEEQDVRVLLLFYSDYAPTMASHAKISEVLRSFKRRAGQFPDGDWREQMYTRAAAAGGQETSRPDPRDHWRRRMQSSPTPAGGREEGSSGSPSGPVSRWAPPEGSSPNRFVAEQEQAVLQIQRVARGAVVRRQLGQGAEQSGGGGEGQERDGAGGDAAHGTEW